MEFELRLVLVTDFFKRGSALPIWYESCSVPINHSQCNRTGKGTISVSVFPFAWKDLGVIVDLPRIFFLMAMSL
jgi:hypothetical protein